MRLNLIVHCVTGDVYAATVEWPVIPQNGDGVNIDGSSDFTVCRVWHDIERGAINVHFSEEIGEEGLKTLLEMESVWKWRKWA